MASKASILGKKYGGKWTYDGPGSSSWSCDDGKRRVRTTCCGSTDYEGEAMCDGSGRACGGPHHWMYGDGVPVRVNFVIHHLTVPALRLVEVL
jgi:hypothetical protein